MPLPSELSLGLVHLTVSDLERSLHFYQTNLGLQLHRRDDAATEGRSAYLGAGRAHLLALTEHTGAKHYRGHTGLYHFAILTPSRLQLAHSLQRLAETRTRLQGFADHLVSEAIYLADPDGNGIELYRDRPRSDWYDAQGNFVMGTQPLDAEGLLRELGGQPGPWPGLHPETVLGHMHLHVRDIPEAQAFYGDLLGFDLMASLGHALFVSAGGYHHHLGLNIWAGQGAPPPPPDATGLRYFTVHLPGQGELDSLLQRVRAAGFGPEEHPLGALVRDPSHNALVFSAGGAE